jgi:hypothetical protein
MPSASDLELGAPSARTAIAVERPAEPVQRGQVAVQARPEFVGLAEFEGALLGGERGRVDEQDPDGDAARDRFLHDGLEAVRVRLDQEIRVRVQNPQDTGGAGGPFQETRVVQLAVLFDPRLAGPLDDRSDHEEREHGADQIGGGVQRIVLPVALQRACHCRQHDNGREPDTQGGEPAPVRDPTYTDPVSQHPHAVPSPDLNR